MTTQAIDFKKPYTTVGGRLPLAYLQDGYGFDRRGRCLGRYDKKGERLSADVKDNEPHANPDTESAGMQPNDEGGGENEQKDSDGETEALGQAEAQEPKTPDSASDAKPRRRRGPKARQ